MPLHVNEGKPGAAGPPGPPGSADSLVREEYPCLTTAGAGDPLCATGVSGTPEGTVQLQVNGLPDYEPSYGSKTGAFYWSVDGGANALATAPVTGAIPYAGSASSKYGVLLRSLSAASDRLSYLYLVPNAA